MQVENAFAANHREASATPRSRRTADGCANQPIQRDQASRPPHGRLSQHPAGYFIGMDIVAIVLIVIVVLALAWLLFTRMRARDHARGIPREKLDSQAAGHREMADAHAASVQELEPEADRHRTAAAEHARQADELEERSERERRHAQFHEERASETEHEREAI